MRVTVFLSIALFAVAAHADYREFRELPIDPALDAQVRAAANESLREFPALKAGDLGLTVVDLTNPAGISRADYDGNVSFYPASVIKVFYLADVYMQNLQDQGDVQRALREMVGVSDNDATAYLVDLLAGTCAGGELEGPAFDRFVDQRREINRHFAKLGYDVGLMMKPWSFAPYGREMQLLGKDRENRNRLTPNATAAMMLWIARGRAPASDVLLEFLHRPMDTRKDDENQIDEFIGEALPAGSRLWSKAGWTSSVRHDAAYVELPSGRKLVMVVFTRGVSNEKDVIPEITRNVLRELESAP